MDITIRKLTPDLAFDYALFFDTTPHYEQGNQAAVPCYCVTWRNDDSYDDQNSHWYETREQRRERAIWFVQHGIIQGYLAYLGNRIIGWCSATGDCHKGVEFMRLYCPIAERGPDTKVKSVFCFVVAPEFRRQGIATMLLEYVLRDAADDGFDYVEAYPLVSSTELDHMGPLAMYLQCGFEVYEDIEERVSVRKALS